MGKELLDQFLKRLLDDSRLARAIHGFHELDCEPFWFLLYAYLRHGSPPHSHHALVERIG